MKKFTVLLMVLFFSSVMVIGQTTTIDFETVGDGYTPSATEGGGSDYMDVFNRTNPNKGGNATFMWSVEDISLTNPSITLDQIDLTGASSFTFSVDMIAHHFNDWDNNDELLITYSIDGGAYQNLMWIQNTGEQYNDPAALDTDFDGDGECSYVLPALTTGTGTDGCVVSNSVFETFSTSAISLSGNSTLDIILQFNGLTSTDEGIYLDNIVIDLNGGSTSPLISVTPSSLTGFNYVLGSGPSASQSFTVEGSDLTADIDVTPSTNYEISSDDVTFQSTAITLTQSGGSVATTTLYTRLKAGLAGGNYDENIVCSSTGATDKNIACSGSVESAATTTLDYAEDFTADLGDCYTYSVAGTTKEWYHNGGDYAEMNGYGSSETEEDWLILPGIDFDSYTYENMTFDSRWKYGANDDATHYFKLYYSTNYSGLGDPSTATWTELAFTVGASDTWAASGDIDLSSISGTSVYIGFKYYYADNYRRWDIDNISITQGLIPLDADFSADHTTVLAGTTVNFTDLTSGGTSPYLYSWDLDGDGVEDDDVQNPSFTYNTVGTYTVELYVVDDDANDNTETKTSYIEVITLPTDIVINEVDADQSGADTEEFIELFGTPNKSLDGLVLVVYNGGTDESYDAWDLDGWSLNANGYFVLGSSTVPNVDSVVSTGFLQNGADAVALYLGDETNFPNGTAVTTSNLVDALVYDTSDGDDAGLLVLLNSGQPQINEGGRGSSTTHSNQRLPNGTGGQRNTTTYDQAMPTPGAENSPSFTDWNGSTDTDWFTDANWSNGEPTATINAVIPEVTAPAVYPIITGSGAAVLDLVVQTNASLTIAPSGQLTVNDQLSNSNGAAGIVLQSTAAGQGSLITDDATYMTVQTYLSNSQWHMVSAPVAADTSGVFLGVYLNEYFEADSSWTYITPVDTSLPLGEGYFAWSASTDYTANHTGVITVADVSPSISYTTPHPHPGGQGWNMVGNPFTSAVEWNANWTLTNVDATMYLYDGTQYKNINTSGVGSLTSQDIPVGQGLWIHANATSPAITIPASERLHSTVGFYKNNVDKILFTIEGNNYSDEMVVQFNDEATVGFDNQYDAYKLKGISAAPQFYMVQEGVNIATNVLPFSKGMTIASNLEVGNNGLYSISMENNQYDGDIYLEDLLTNTVTNLSNEVYTFFANTEDVASRFVIHFDSPTGIENGENVNVNIYSDDNTIYILSGKEMNASLKAYDLLGQEVLNQNINGVSESIDIDNYHGYLILSLENNNEIITKKVYIK